MVPKSFSMETPADFMAKLRWERRRLYAIPISENPAFQYQAVNCAADAWHMADWVYHHLPSSEKQKFSKDTKFRDHIYNESRCLRICREIADATKHFDLKKKPHQDISTRVLAHAETGLGIDLWYIQNDHRADDPRQIIDGAISYWEIYMEHHGIPHTRDEVAPS